MGAVDAVVFDLYGTLLEVGSRSIHREVPRLLGGRREKWMELLRGPLLTRSFPDDGAFVRFVAESLAPGAPAEALEACLASVRREIASVSPVPGILALLSFYKRRGLKLGLVSNLSSVHKEPLERYRIPELLDAMALSCEEGTTKPDPQIYLRLLGRLGVAPERSLFVGDFGPNDVKAPAALGMKTAGVGVAGHHAAVLAVPELGLLDVEGGTFAPLLTAGDTVALGGTPLVVESLAAIPDDDLGRYNLVFRVVAKDSAGAARRLYVKRFLLPETAWLEEFAYRLQRATGLVACEAVVKPGVEPLIVVSEAPGGKLEGALDVETAREAGRHFGFGFLFSNADLRPRNAFLARSNGGAPRLTVVDLEHCLFNLAIDTTGLAHPERPQTFDAMTADELASRTRRRVLTRKTSPRARKTFLEGASRDSAIGRAFDEGFQEFYAEQRRRAGELVDLVSERVRSSPPLVIGTQSYRRAMATPDVEDIRARLAMTPSEAVDWMW